MATISADTIRSLAVLYAIDRWNQGSPGKQCLQEALFSADKEVPGQRLMTYRRFRLGQYSDQLPTILNELMGAERIRIRFSGPTESIEARITPEAREAVARAIKAALPRWTASFEESFKAWGCLKDDEVLEKAHDVQAGASAQLGETIFESDIPDEMEVPGMAEDEVERLSRLVSLSFWNRVKTRLGKAAMTPAVDVDWRHRYFEDILEDRDNLHADNI